MSSTTNVISRAGVASVADAEDGSTARRSGILQAGFVVAPILAGSTSSSTCSRTGTSTCRRS